MKYSVTLTPDQRQELLDLVKAGKAPAHKIRHAKILLVSDKATTCLSAWAAAEATGCHSQTVYETRKRFVLGGLAGAIERRTRSDLNPPRLDEAAIARLLELSRQPTPPGVNRLSLRALKDKLIDEGLVDNVSHETVRQALMKAAAEAADGTGGQARCRSGILPR